MGFLKDVITLQLSIFGYILILWLILYQVMSDVLSTESLLWKLNMVKSGSAYANSRLHAVKSETLVLSRFSFSLHQDQNSKLIAEKLT